MIDILCKFGLFSQSISVMLMTAGPYVNKGALRTSKNFLSTYHYTKVLSDAALVFFYSKV